jgi:molecular chaperone HtpG
MREQFTVDLRGLVEILSHHLYRNERVYLRELVQNAHDAIQARAALGHEVDGEIEIVPARGYEQLVVRDNGIGLTESDMRALLSIIGSTSKRSDVAAVRRQFLGQFGIGLLSCFLVADTIEVISRSARTPDAPTVRWVGESDGTFTIGPALKPLAEPGTEVRLRPRHGYHRFCDTDACTQFASEFAELLDVPVRIGATTLSQQPRPWTLPTEEQLAWCQERFGFEAMGIIPFDTRSAGVVGLAFVLPYTARPGYRTGDRIYSKGMLVADTDDLVIPRWAFFCRAVVDAGDLPLTASREGLQESGELQFVRKQIGFRLLTELIIVQGQHPDVYADIVRLHADGLKALAVQEPDVRDLLIATLPFETTLGERTIQRLIDGPGPVPFVRDADTYAALADVAAHAGVLVVNAGGLHEAELLSVVDEPGQFREVSAADVVELARPVPHPDAHAAAALSAKARAAIVEEGLAVDVGSFEPADRPVLWWPTAPGHARMVLNAANRGEAATRRPARDRPRPRTAGPVRRGPARRTRDAHPRPGRDARRRGAGHGRRPAVRRRVVRPARPAAPRAPRDRRAAGVAAGSSPWPGTPA